MSLRSLAAEEQSSCSFPFSAASCVHFKDNCSKSLFPCLRVLFLLGGGDGERSELVINSPLTPLSDGNQLRDIDIKTASCLSIFKRSRNNKGFRE